MTTLFLFLALVRQPGSDHTFTIQSEILKQTRTVQVHLPPSFAKSAPSRRYPTMVVLDGQWLLDSVVPTAEVLASHGQIPESVIVAIENTDDYEGRVHDLTPPGLSVSGSSRNEGGDRFLDFIEKELLPAVDAQFKGGNPRTLIGTSSGGILVTYAAAARPAFRFALALDTPTHLDDNWLIKKVVERARTSTSPMHYASLEARFGWSDEAWKQLTSAAPSNWLLYREHLPHESHTSMQFAGAYIGLREIFRDYSMITTQNAPTTSILPAYEKLASSYGATVIPPAPLLREAIDDLLMEGRGAAAHAAFDMLASSYGEPSNAAKTRERIADVERQPPPTETVESLLATPFPTPAEAREYLGEWEGEEWMNPEVKSRMVLRIAEEDGKVVATVINWPEPDMEMKRPMQYLKVTPHGLTFGDMNGMRPRGVILHEGVRKGDVLAGTERFGGIRFNSPDGRMPPTIHFELRKKKT
jgi:hypothetical protein